MNAGLPNQCPVRMMQRRQPDQQAGQRQKEPQRAPTVAFQQQPESKQSRRHDPGLLHQHQNRTHDRRRAKTVLQKQQQRQYREAHRRHVQLRQHRLREEQRRKAEQRDRRESRRPGGSARQFNPQQKRRESAQRRDHQHRDPRDHNGIAEDRPPHREISHHARRMNIGRSRDSESTRRAKQIERSRDELPRLIPVKRKFEQRAVGQNQKQRQSARRPAARYDRSRTGGLRRGRPLRTLLNESRASPGFQTDFTERGLILADVLLQTFNKAFACCGLI